MTEWLMVIGVGIGTYLARVSFIVLFSPDVVRRPDSTRSDGWMGRF